MPTARGAFNVANNCFEGDFEAEGFLVHVEGHFSQSVGIVFAPNSHVEYDSLSDFEGSYSVESGGPASFVGSTSIDIQFKGPGGKRLKVTGLLSGGLDKRHTITGSGTWSKSRED